jgi:transposase
MTIPHVGPITSLAFVNVMAEPTLFKNGRQFADYCGETPYHTGSGGKIIVLGVNRKGNSVLKRSLYEAASGLYNRVKTGIESKTCHYYQSDWILNLVRSKPRKVAICAIANKMCRIAWAVAATENGRYDRTKTSLVSVLMKSPEQIEQQKAAKAQAKAQAAAKAA